MFMRNGRALPLQPLKMNCSIYNSELTVYSKESTIMSERATAPASAPTSDMATETAPEHMPDPNAKLTTREKKWIVYDVGNSAFVMLSTAVVPIYANSLLQSAGQSNIVSTWGYAQTIASLIIAVMMPVLGSMADVQGMKVKFFTGFFLTGVVACCAMALPLSWLVFLVVCILATVGLNGSLTFYDSMLVDITSNERMDACPRMVSHGAILLHDSVHRLYRADFRRSVVVWMVHGGMHACFVRNHRIVVGGVHHSAAHQL